jgi:hypothetical protein
MGYGLGQFKGDIGKMSNGFAINSFIDAAGRTDNLGLWDDRLLGAHLSLGLETVTTHATGNFSGDVSLPILNTTTVSSSAYANAYLEYLDLAYRPQAGSWLHPFIGGGLGGGRASVRANYRLENSNGFVNDYVVHDVSSYAGAVQAFGGVQADIGRGFYISPELRVQYFTTRPVGKPDTYIQSDVNLSLGYKF